MIVIVKEVQKAKIVVLKELQFSVELGFYTMKRASGTDQKNFAMPDGLKTYTIDIYQRKNQFDG